MSQAGFDRAKIICEYISNVICDRNGYLQRNNLDVSINNPAANWSLENTFFDGYRALASKNYDSINMLRVFSQMFSGNYLGVKHAAGMPVPKVLPKNLNEDVLYYMGNEPHWWIESYVNLIAEFPAIGHLSPPRTFGESGYLVNGVIVNHDTYVYMERVALLEKSRLIERLRQKKRPIILEIGCGYGAVAYYLKRLLPECVYICVDLPESLIFSAIYLDRFFGDSLLFNDGIDVNRVCEHGCVFVPNYMFHKLTESDQKIDLAVNTLSMSEMTSAQVAYYCEGLKKMMGSEGVFFEQNQDNRHVGLVYANELISRHFSHRREVLLRSDLTQGAATIWANNVKALA